MKQTAFTVAVCCSICFTISAQTPLKLSLSQAVEMTGKGTGNASVEMATAALKVAEARRAQAHALLFPVVESSFTEQNVTRNLAAEGFNFPTGVPNFTIPQEVGPFNTYDVRLALNQNLFDLSALRRAHGLKASAEAAHAEIARRRDVSAAQVAHDYLLAIRADASQEAARAAVGLSETLLAIAQDRENGGQAAALEVTRAKLRLATDRRRVAAMEGERVQARLQLLSDLGLDLDTPLELTDRLAYAPEPIPNVQSSVATALHSRTDLQVTQKREEEARIYHSAIGLERVPSVVAYGDVGPLSSILTHTVGVSIKIPVFDGGRRAARKEEAMATVQQAQIQERELKRQIELQVRRAKAAIEAAAADIEACDAALALAEEGLAQARRRFEGGVTSNLEVVDAQAVLGLSRENRIGAAFAWHQARIDLAEASGTIGSVTMPQAR